MGVLLSGRKAFWNFDGEIPESHLLCLRSQKCPANHSFAMMWLCGICGEDWF